MLIIVNDWNVNKTKGINLRSVDTYSYLNPNGEIQFNRTTWNPLIILSYQYKRHDSEPYALG